MDTEEVDHCSAFVYSLTVRIHQESAENDCSKNKSVLELICMTILTRL